jgi:hypothetical protein
MRDNGSRRAAVTASSIQASTVAAGTAATVAARFRHDTKAVRVMGRGHPRDRPVDDLTLDKIRYQEFEPSPSKEYASIFRTGSVGGQMDACITQDNVLYHA